MGDRNRIVVLIDMDCFYVQCEQRLESDKWLKPCVVAQYNNWQGGGIIAVNYEARAYGIKRGMMGDQAKKLCPELHIFRVPDENGKAKLDKYRDASAEVFQVISDFIEEQEKSMDLNNLVILERASVDEAFLDLTKLIDAKPLMLPELEDLTNFNTKLEFNNQSLNDWFDQFEHHNIDNRQQQDNIRLIMASMFVGQLRQQIFEKTEFKCSAGISHNKMLSKLACGLNKPNAQTILPMIAVSSLFKRIDIGDVRLLGGKLGNQIKTIFNIQTMYQLSQVNRFTLNEKFDNKTAEWLNDLANGLDNEPVSDRRLTKSIGCGKNFRGKMALCKQSDVNQWINSLLKELYERMMKDKEMNQRLARLMIVGYYTAGKGHCHRSIPIDITLGDYPPAERIASDIMRQLFSKPLIIIQDPIQNLSLAATKFLDTTKAIMYSTAKIEKFFQKIDRITFIGQQQQQQPKSSKNHSTINQPPIQSKSPIKKSIQMVGKKSPMKNKSNNNNKSSTTVQSNTLDRYLQQYQRQSTSKTNNDDKIDLNDPHVRQINREMNQLLDSFFFSKILCMLENGTLKI
uniref:DNA polymerase eta n=1 Tax=Dermatophagoides pteronyssinus TaxID=6956 RepID=A0A6P6XJF1_DERPT|nr:DNA polymerase eta-like [Dermatophagoides pteronyssinus]